MSLITGMESIRFQSLKPLLVTVLFLVYLGNFYILSRYLLCLNLATLNKYDVVLIDTAGRMQDNAPLMLQLTKLVSVVNPDKIIFVGEALVGNQCLVQLSSFQSSILKQTERGIDGIVVSKFDTVGDQVGACVSMTACIQKPIFFCGTGQGYTDLKRINIKSVVGLLLDS
jgi:signal recognition particle receptor subunit alpha